jgi:alginate O-acetyltransferase complex protein AlgI
MGLAGGAALAAAAPYLDRDTVGWLGIAVVLTTIHLGFSDVLSGGLGRRYPGPRLFADPVASRSLREFWSLRWNTAYVEMNRVIFAPFARRWFGRYANVALFALSGLLHETAISVPVMRGFGGPTTYFLLHAAAVHLEPRIGLVRWPRPLAGLWTWCWVLAPLPLLFHAPFRDALVVPLFTVWSAR